MAELSDDEVAVITVVSGVVIVGIGVATWWFILGGQCGQYKDVTKEEKVDYTAYNQVGYPYEHEHFVQISYEPAPKDYWDLIWRTSVPYGVASVKDLTFNGIPQAINDNLVGVQKQIGTHIWEAIAKGCVP